MSLGLLRRAPSGAYALGPAVLALGFEYLASFDIVELSGPVLARLRDEIGCSTHLAMLDRTSVLFLARYAVRSAVSSSFGIGFSAPAHASAIGRLLLGDFEGDEVAKLYRGVRLARAGPDVPTSLSMLQKRIAEIRGAMKDNVLTAAAEISAQLGAAPV